MGRNLRVPAVGKRWEFRDRNGQEFRDGIVSLRWEKGRNLGMGTCPCGGKKARILAWEYVPEVGKRAGIWRYFRAGIQ